MSLRASKTYLLVLLMLVLASNCMDRWALGVVQEDIKRDLALTDTQLGLLTGIAFALFYAVMGIPLARWADRGDRVRIIALTTALWSAAVATCGAAASFVQLLLVRIGVAVGEAGCMPTAHSLIADYFTRAERPRAVSQFLLGIPLSLVVGYFAAGWLNELWGWRWSFAVMGLPGLLLAILVLFTLKDPREHQVGGARRSPDSALAQEVTPPLKAVIVMLWKRSSFRHLLACYSVWYFFGYGLQQWQPTFFIRSHGLATGEVGTWFAVIYGLGGGLGTYLGGALASRYAASKERWQLIACGGGFMMSSLLELGVYLVRDVHLAFALLTVDSLISTMVQGPILATLQTLVPARMRAMSIALVYLLANLIGMGLGPLSAGVLSDGFAKVLGQESLRYALMALCPGYLWAAWHLWRASRTVDRDIFDAQAQDGEFI